MGIVTYDKANVLFQTLCFFFAIYLVVSWLQRYSLHKLASSIDLKYYFDTTIDLHPAFSICATDPELNEKVKKIAPGYNKSNYIKFLRGEVYHEELKNLEFEHVKFNWSQYFDQQTWPYAKIVAKNGTEMGRFPMGKYWKYYTSYVGLHLDNRYLTNCLAVEPLTNEVDYIKIVLNRSIFKEKKRPNYTFRVLFHYPHQILRSYLTSKYLWEDWNSTKDYKMRFFVADVVVLQHLSNKNKKCIADWNNYDEVVLDKHLENVGCRAPYQGNNGRLMNVCSTARQMRQSILHIDTKMVKMFDNPCRSLETARYRFMETVSDKEPRDIFEMKFRFNGDYREITQYEQIDIEVC